MMMKDPDFEMGQMVMLQARATLRGGPHYVPSPRFTMTQAFVLLDDAFSEPEPPFRLIEDRPLGDPSIPYCSNDCGNGLTITDYGTVCRRCRIGGPRIG